MTSSKEKWKIIPGYEPYQASTWGRIKGRRVSIMSPFLNKWGYELVKLSFNGKAKNYSVHRLVMLAFQGPSDLEVNHIDGDKTNNSLENLEYVTTQENKIHAWERGLYSIKKGQEVASSKLSERDVVELKRFHEEGVPQRLLARAYGISYQALNDLLHHRTWEDVYAF